MLRLFEWVWDVSSYNRNSKKAKCRRSKWLECYVCCKYWINALNSHWYWVVSIYFINLFTRALNILNIDDSNYDYLSLFSTEYLTYAEIYVTKRGFRRLVYNGEQFGESRAGPNNITKWRCVSQIINKISKKSGKCKAHLQTKVIKGYEMIRDPNEAKHCEHRAVFKRPASCKEGVCTKKNNKLN